MPAIPVFTQSPINAAKAPGPTSQTTPTRSQDTGNPVPAAAATTTAASPYAPAQPRASPSIPAPTSAFNSLNQSHIQPTSTQPGQYFGPPAPQPGASPVPPRTKSPLPPPPKAGKTMTQHSPNHTTTMPMPPQMSYPVPNQSYQTYSTTATTASYPSGPTPSILQAPVDYSHPPGYQQNGNDSNFSSQQRSTHNGYVSHNRADVFSASEEGEGVWDTAKKWAAAAGDRLAAAENEVWKKINKE